MQWLGNHITRSVLAGLAAILPIGGTLVLLFLLDDQLEPLVNRLPVQFPGLGLIVAILAVYLLGVTVSTVVGRWLWGFIDRLLDRVPALGPAYQTLKQILGYGQGEHAIFRRVVLVRNDAIGGSELGLVTGEVTLPGSPGEQLAVFVPSAPNPANGRLLVVPADRCTPQEMPVDAALKALFSVGKTLS